jgi:hypothetical protein
MDGFFVAHSLPVAVAEIGEVAHFASQSVRIKSIENQTSSHGADRAIFLPRDVLDLPLFIKPQSDGQIDFLALIVLSQLLHVR